MPVVMFDRVTREVYTDKVIIDDVLATQEAIQYFISKGRKKIGFITTPDYISVGRLRTEGYKRTLEANGIAIDENLILRIEDESKIDTMINEFFNNNEFDAVMAVNELYAVNVLRNAKKRGIRVPEDLFLIAFTDGVISRNSIPSISTVKQNAYKMGEIAARLLIKKLESENGHEHYITEVIGTELLHRETTTI